MSIPFIDLKAQYTHLKSDIDSRIQAVLDHGRYIMGPEVAELEEQLADFCGAKHAVTVANGTDALQIALMAKGVGASDAVFVPSFTFTATAEVVLLLGATPVFVDVDDVTFNIDTDDLARKVNAIVKEGALLPRGIIAVDLFGQPADYPAIQALADNHRMFVLADAAQSFGASLHGKKVGTLAEMTSTSFFPAKPLGCYGDGGALFTDDDELANVFKSIRLHGKGGAKYDIARVGVNSRLDTIQAAILLAKLAAFPAELESRDRIAQHYTQHLSNIALTPRLMDGATSAWAQYTLRVESRDGLAAKLKDREVPSAIYYPLPMHLQAAYRTFGNGENSIPVSEKLSGEVLSLPMHPYMGLDTADHVCQIIAECVA